MTVPPEEQPDPFLTHSQRASSNRKGTGRQTCKLPECNTKHYARGWCERHFLRWWRTGTPRGAKAVRDRALEQVPVHEEHKGQHVPWTEAEKAQVVSLRQKGWTYIMIARATGRTRNSVSMFMRRRSAEWG